MGNKTLSMLLVVMMGVVGVIGYLGYGAYQEYAVSEVKEEKELNISIEEKMLKSFNEQDYMNVILHYKNGFLSNENDIEPTEKAVEMYNEAIFNTFNEAEGIVLHDYSWLDSEHIDKDVWAFIETKFKDEIEEFKKCGNKIDNENEIDEEVRDLIEKVKNKIVVADALDDIEKMIEGVSLAECIDQSVDYELNVALTFAKMRISTSESVWIQENPSYVRTTTEEDGKTINIARLVHPSYEGILSERIKKILSNYRYTRETWVAEYNKHNNIEMQDLSIGMTQQEVIDLTTWGRPKKINKTETTSGVSEQWVYPNYQYLYFTDGILTSISTND